MIRITPEIAINEGELRYDFIRASGPGGQKVNKASTAVQLRFDVAGSPNLPEELRGRLVALAGRRLSENGVLIIEAKRFRSQERNRQDALDRLTALVREAARRPRPRRPSAPGAAARRRRLEEKKRRAEIKRRRGRPDSSEQD